MFGQPNSRQRTWRIIYAKKTKKWNCKYSLEVFAQILLLPETIPLKLDYNVYLTAANTDEYRVREDQLTALLGALLVLFCLTGIIRIP